MKTRPLPVTDSQRMLPDYISHVFPKTWHSWFNIPEWERNKLIKEEKEKLINSGWSEQADGSYLPPYKLYWYGPNNCFAMKVVD